MRLFPCDSSHRYSRSDNGKIVLVYVKHSPKCVGDCGTGNGVVYSSDGGATWTSPEDVSSDFGPASGSLPGPGLALQTKAGRIMVISHHSAYQRDYVSFSDNGGKKWSTINQTFPLMDEATLTQLTNGSIMLNMRHKAAKTRGRAISVSDDGGDTFGPIYYDHALISPVCQASIATFAGSTYVPNG